MPGDLISEFFLKNGLRVILIKRKDTESLFISCLVKYKWPEDKFEVIHLLEHVLMNGIGDHPSFFELFNYIENDLNGDFQINAHKNFLRIDLSIPKNNLNPAIKIIKEIFANNLLNNISAEKKRIIIEGNYKASDIETTINNLELQTIFKEENTFSLKNAKKFYDHLDKISKIELRKVLKTIFLANNIVFFVLGDFDVKKLVNIFEKEWNSVPYKKKNGEEFIKQEENINKNMLLIGNVPFLRTAFISIFIPVKIEINLKNLETLTCLNELLVNQKSSLIFSQLCNRGLIYDMRGTVKIFPQQKELVFLKWKLISDFQNIKIVLKTIINELKNSLFRIQINNHRLNSIKRKLITSLIFEYKNPLDALDRYITDFLLYDQVITIDHHKKTLDQIQISDLKQILFCLNLKDTNITVISGQKMNEKDKKELIKILKSLN